MSNKTQEALEAFHEDCVSRVDAMVRNLNTPIAGDAEAEMIAQGRERIAQLRNQCTELTEEQAAAFRKRSERRLGLGLRNLNYNAARGYIRRADMRGDPHDDHYRYCQEVVAKIGEEMRRESAE